MLLNNSQKSDVEALSDAARLLCDVHHTQSLSGHTLIGVSLKIDIMLFREDLGERISKFKALQRSSADLLPKTKAKPLASTSTTQGNHLNSRSLPRQPAVRLTRPGRRQEPRNYSLRDQNFKTAYRTRSSLKYKNFPVNQRRH